MELEKNGFEFQASHQELASEGEELEVVRQVGVRGDSSNDVDVYESGKFDLRTAMGLLAMGFTYEACLFPFAMLSAILLTINQDVGPFSSISWVATSWALASAVAMTIAGRCSDIFGRRNFFLTGNMFGLIGSAIFCRASTLGALVAGGTFLGLGAGLQQLAFAAANEIVPKRSRGHVLALLSLVSLPASSFGAPIGYALVASLSWRWAFYLSILVNALAFVLVLVFYWPPGFLSLHENGKTRRQQFCELDFVGLLLFGGGLSVLLFGLGLGGNPDPWTKPTVLAPMIVGVIAVFLAFPLWEAFSSNDKIANLCPPRLMNDKRAVFVPLAVSFVSGMGLISLAVLWPQQVQQLYTTDPTLVGWYCFAFNCPATFGVILGGQSISTFRRTRYQYIFVVGMMAIFLGLLGTATQHTPARAIAFVAIASLMIGATNCVSILIVQLGARDEDIGVATGLVNSLRSTGGAIGVAIYSSVLSNRVSSTLARNVGGAVVQAGLPLSSVPAFLASLLTGSQAAIHAVHGITPAIVEAGLEAHKTTYSDAYRLVYCISVAFGGLAVLGALFIANVDDQLTQKVNVRLDKPHLVGHGNGEAKILHQTDEVVQTVRDTTCCTRKM